MSISFDVLTQPWIPVVDKDGKEAELGLLDALSQAHQWRRIHHPSPLVEYSIYRFLVIFLMDAFRPQERFDLEDLLAEGQFDRERLENYVAVCQQEGVRFDLFDPERPFLQVQTRSDWDRDPKPASTMDYSVPNGNNPVHFDHCRVKKAYSPGEALQLMLEAQFFCTAAAQGYPSNVNGAPPWYAVVEGENLFQTLIYSMISLEEIDIPFDQPPVLWRSREEVVSKQKVSRTSWLMGMLFPARRIRLMPNADGLVEQVFLSQGMDFAAMDGWTDPHVTYRYNDKGRLNWKPNDDDSVWRNVRDLMDTGKQHAPQIVSQYHAIHPLRRHLRLTLYGVQTNQASYIRVRRHDLRLPNDLLGRRAVLDYLQVFVACGDQLAKSVWKSLLQKEIPEALRTQTKAVFYRQCEELMWSSMEALDQQQPDLQALMNHAVDEMCHFARRCCAQALSQLNLRGRTMLEVMQTQQSVLNQTIQKLQKEGKR